MCRTIGEKEVLFSLRFWAIWKSIFRSRKIFGSPWTREETGANDFGLKLSGFHLKPQRSWRDRCEDVLIAEPAAINPLWSRLTVGGPVWEFLVSVKKVTVGLAVIKAAQWVSAAFAPANCRTSKVELEMRRSNGVVTVTEDDAK